MSLEARIPKRNRSSREITTGQGQQGENISPIFRATKSYDLPDFRSGVLLQHGETRQEIIVDRDIAEYVDTLGQSQGMTREQVADAMETTLSHVDRMNLAAEVAFEDRLIRPVSRNTDRGEVFRLELFPPQTATQSEDIAGAPLADVIEITDGKGPVQSIDPRVNDLVNELGPFMRLPDKIVETITEKVSTIDAFTDSKALFAATKSDDLTIPLTKVGEPGTIVEIVDPEEYFERRVDHYTKIDPLGDAEGDALRDTKGKIAARLVRKELHTKQQEQNPVSTEQLAAAEEIAERACKTLFVPSAEYV